MNAINYYMRRIRQAIVLDRIIAISLTEHLRSKTHQKPLKDKIFISQRSNRRKIDQTKKSIKIEKLRFASVMHFTNFSYANKTH